MKLEHIPFFAAGAIAAVNFARTAWVFPDISRWFYLGDAVMAGMWLCVAIVFSRAVSSQNQTGE